MEESELRSLIRDRLGLRIEPEMSKYVLRRAGESNQPIAVIGSDARTGAARRQIVDPRLLLPEAP
ncbi:MAG: hypothetical protein ABSB74_21270 [Tepidisphaeraceae bacterium]